jgi:hypothetical protein
MDKMIANWMVWCVILIIVAALVGWMAPAYNIFAVAYWYVWLAVAGFVLNYLFEPPVSWGS